jgi:hypothetical protein
VADPLRVEGVDRYRGGKDPRSFDKSGGLSFHT